MPALEPRFVVEKNLIRSRPVWADSIAVNRVRPVKNKTKMEPVPAAKGDHDSQTAATEVFRAPSTCSSASSISDDLDAHYDRLRRWAVRLARRRGVGDDAEDVFHDALVSELRNCDIRDPRFHPFLRRRFRDRCRSAYRTAIKRQDWLISNCDQVAELFHSSDWEVPTTALQVLLEQQLNALPESERVLVGLCYFQDLSHSQVANYLRTSVPAVKAKIFRIRGKLRDKLEAARSAARTSV